MAVNFYLDKRTDKKGDAPIRVSVVIRGARLLTSTGCKIAPAKWDAAKQQARRGCSNANGVTYSVINTMLAKIVDYFAAYENECITENRRPDTATLKNEFAENFGRKHTANRKAACAVTLLDYLAMFTAEMGDINQWTDGTHKKFAALKNHFLEYDAKLTFADLDEKGLNSFVAYLRAKDMKNTTISKQIGLVKWFLRWATAKGYNTNTAFQSYAPKFKIAPKKVVFLDWGELMRVFNYSIPRNGEIVTLHRADGSEYEKVVREAGAISKTRDIFCFCCFTSLRYSDAANLKWPNINGNTFSVTTIKTADTLTIEINKYARAILDKYAGREDAGGFVFPHITNQRMNVYIKDLCELCEINQPITKTYYKGSQRIDETAPKYELIGTHTGRRTFICNALTLGIPAEIVMKWTGHSDYKAMKPYIDVTSAAKANAMRLFDAL